MDAGSDTNDIVPRTCHSPGHMPERSGEKETLSHLNQKELKPDKNSSSNNEEGRHWSKWNKQKLKFRIQKMKSSSSSNVSSDANENCWRIQKLKLKRTMNRNSSLSSSSPDANKSSAGTVSPVQEPSADRAGDVMSDMINEELGTCNSSEEIPDRMEEIEKVPHSSRKELKSERNSSSGNDEGDRWSKQKLKLRIKSRKSSSVSDANDSPTATVSAVQKTSSDGNDGESDLTGLDSPEKSGSKYNPKPVVSDSDSDETYIGEEDNVRLEEDMESSLPKLNDSSDSDRTMIDEDIHEEHPEQCLEVYPPGSEPDEAELIGTNGENVCSDHDSPSHSSCQSSPDIVAARTKRIKGKPQDNDKSQSVSSSDEDSKTLKGKTVKQYLSSDRRRAVISAKEGSDDAEDCLPSKHHEEQKGPSVQNPPSRKRLILALSPKKKKREDVKSKWKMIERPVASSNGRNIPKETKILEEIKIKEEREISPKREMSDDVINISDDSEDESADSRNSGDTKQVTSSKNGIKSRSFYGSKDSSKGGKRKSSWNDLSKSDLDMTDSDISEAEAEAERHSPTSGVLIDSGSNPSQEDSSLSSQMSERDIFSKLPESTVLPVSEESQSERTSTFPSGSDLSFLDTEEMDESASNRSSRGKGKAPKKARTGSKVGNQKKQSFAVPRDTSVTHGEPSGEEDGQEHSVNEDTSGEYFPRDSQLSFDVNSTQDDGETSSQYFPRDSQLSFDLNSTQEISEQDQNSEGTSSWQNSEGTAIWQNSEGTAIQSDPPRQFRGCADGKLSNQTTPKDGQKKQLPCLKEAWSVEDLTADQRFLLLHEQDPEVCNPSSPVFLDMVPSEPEESADTVSAAEETNTDNGIRNRQGDKKSVPSTSASASARRPKGKKTPGLALKQAVPVKASRAASLLQTMKETKLSQQKKGTTKKPSQIPVPTKQQPVQSKQQQSGDNVDVQPGNSTQKNRDTTDQQRSAVGEKQASDHVHAQGVPPTAQKPDHSGQEPCHTGQDPNLNGQPLHTGQDPVHTRQETVHTGQQNVCSDRPTSVQTEKSNADKSTKQQPSISTRQHSGQQPERSGQQNDPVHTKQQQARNTVQQCSVPKGYQPVETVPAVQKAAQSRESPLVSTTSLRSSSTVTVPSASAVSRPNLPVVNLPTQNKEVSTHDDK